MTNSFKTCPTCGKTWFSQKHFISDPSLKLNGYTAHFKKLERGMFFFTHSVQNCKTTMALEVSHFQNLYTGIRYTQKRARMDDCPGYCLDKTQLNRCDAYCECAFAREISNILKNYPKKE